MVSINAEDVNYMFNYRTLNKACWNEVRLHVEGDVFFREYDDKVEVRIVINII